MPRPPDHAIRKCGRDRVDPGLLRRAGLSGDLALTQTRRLAQSASANVAVQPALIGLRDQHRFTRLHRFNHRGRLGGGQCGECSLLRREHGHMDDPARTTVSTIKAA
jgi:hypothetical protein